MLSSHRGHLPNPVPPPCLRDRSNRWLGRRTLTLEVTDHRYTLGIQMKANIWLAIQQRHLLRLTLWHLVPPKSECDWLPKSSSRHPDRQCVRKRRRDGRIAWVVE